ncbi:MAG: C1 family peptidase [Bacteroidales bacterium]|nr:C1 family peptidase [Bacteroidales bacterium]
MITAIFFGINLNLAAQDESEAKEEKKGYEFTIVKELPTTSVKNQYRSGTCWSFSSLSFLESELLRMGKGEYDLAEMFIVRSTYAEKAKKYIRFHGKINFSGGGAFHDATHIMKTYGIVPEDVYNGLTIGEDKHIHGELDAVSNGFIGAVLKNKNKKISPVWADAYNGILDAYLGEYPESFTYNDKKYTPETFARELGLNPDDYVEIGSYSHHPFYSKFILEVPDNWMLDKIYNIPLDDMMEVINYAIDKGYTVAWGSDVSEKGFSWKTGIAIVPDEELSDLSGTEKEKWEKLTDKEKQKALYSFEEPVKEKIITQEIRQEQFDNYQTTDDHGMHITGIAKDQDGNVFYKVKNSWGTADHIYDGYFYASEAFIRLKTIDIMVHKDAVPKDIRNKLGF